MKRAANEPPENNPQQSKRPKAEDIKLKLLKAKQLKDQIRANLLKAKARTEPKPQKEDETITKKAKHYDLDIQLDINNTKTIQINVTKKVEKVNPYLVTADEIDDTTKRKKGGLKFFEPGEIVERAEKQRIKLLNAEQAGFLSNRQTSKFLAQTSLMEGAGFVSSIASPTETVSAKFCTKLHKVPLVCEWWDLDFLKKQDRVKVSELQGQLLKQETLSRTTSKLSQSMRDLEKNITAIGDLNFNLKYCRTASLVQHPVPIEPISSNLKPKQGTIYLTKKELKKQRKQRRAQNLQEKRDQQALGLIPAPEPKLTMGNFMQVLGDAAVLDPSKIEAVVQAKIQARKLKHEQMNLEKKLTSSERQQKKESKFANSTKVAIEEGAIEVALFYVRDMSHRYHRATIDKNAQQMSISGLVLELPSLSLILAEGSKRAIKRFIRLMTIRMKWGGPDNQDHNVIVDEKGDQDSTSMGEDQQKQLMPFNKENKCQLVWNGLAAKRLFPTFVFESVDDVTMARKFLESKNVGHYWDQVVAVAEKNR